MCNKYGAQPFPDIEEDLLDRFVNGDKSIIIDVTRRLVDASQCAAIVETLRYDQYVCAACTRKVVRGHPDLRSAGRRRGHFGAGDHPHLQHDSPVAVDSRTQDPVEGGQSPPRHL